MKIGKNIAKKHVRVRLVSEFDLQNSKETNPSSGKTSILKSKRKEQKKIIVKKKCYLASPLGFSEVGRLFMKQRLVPFLKAMNLKVLNPWDFQDLNDEMESINTIQNFDKRVSRLRIINEAIARKNQSMIDEADILIAVLDGVDVDSGTASEIGYAYAKNKKVYGYRGDFRLSSDNIGSKVNLQVEYFCESIVFDLQSLKHSVLQSLS